MIVETRHDVVSEKHYNDALLTCYKTVYFILKENNLINKISVKF